MGPIRQIFLGINSYRRSFGIIRECGLGKYFVLPVIINVALVVLLWYGSGWLGDWLGDWLTAKLSADGGGFWGFLTSLLTGIIKVVAYLLFIFVGGQIVNMLMAPVYSILSEKVDQHITHRTYETTASMTMSDIWRGVVITFKCTIKELVVTSLLLLLNLVPVIGTVASLVLIFLVNCYYFGYSFLDYAHERARRNADATSSEVFKYKYLAITIGALYALSLYAVCGAFIAAFVGGLSTIAATLAQLKLDGYGDNVE